MSDGKSELSFKYKWNEYDILQFVRRQEEGGEEQPVPLDAENLAFCEFLTWACKHQRDNLPGAFHRIKEEATAEFFFFCRMEDLVDYCKRGTAVLLPPLASDELRFRRKHSDFYLPLNIQCVDAAPVADEETPSASFFRLYEVVSSLEPEFKDQAYIGDKALPVFVSVQLQKQLADIFRNKQDSELLHLCFGKIERTFVYFDISDFSRHPKSHQLLIINSLIKIASDDHLWPPTGLDPRSDCEASLCIGDGYIYVFQTPGKAAHFAAYLANLVEHRIARGGLIEFHFRIGVHTGSVYRFWDRLSVKSPPTAGRWNYVGKGITEGERVLAAIGKDKDDVVYISAETRQRILGNLHEAQVLGIENSLENRGRHADKHGKFRRLYELNHTGWVKHYDISLNWQKP